MMQRSLQRSGAALLLLAAMACAKAGALPVANLEADRSVSTGSVVTVDGHLSSKGPGITYAWSFVSLPGGSQATFSLADTAQAVFTADVAGKYVIRLVVHDQDYASDPAFTTITATDCGAHAPTVGSPVATPNNSGVGVSVKLTAPEVTDLDDAAGCGLKQVLSYDWSITSQPAGSRARLNDAHALSPIFTPDAPGTWRVQLVVTDSTGLSSDPATGSIPVTVLGCGSNVPRIDSITASSTSPGLGTTVQFTAAVTDDDNNPTCNLHRTLHYAWSVISLPSGSLAALNDPAVQNPTITPDVPGDYVVRLVVSDELGHSSPAQDATITASACGELPVPSLSFSPATPGLGSPVQLTASTVFVPLNCPIATIGAYHWSILTQPLSSTATLNAPGSQNPSFTPDQPGTYSIGLIVDDEVGFSSPLQTIDITVGSDCGNNRPTINSLTASVASPVVGQQVLITPDVFDADLRCTPFDPTRTFKWSLAAKPDASKTFFEAPVAVATTFSDPAQIGKLTVDVPGTYQIQLVVTDATGLSSDPALMTLSTSACGLAKPSVTSVRSDVSAPTLGQTVKLSATVQDADTACGLNDAFALSWRITTRPSGSAAVLSNPTANNPTLIPDVSGDYQIAVVATDLANGLVSAPAWVSFSTNSCGTHAPAVQATPAQAGTTPGAGVTLTALPSDPDAGCGAVKSFTYRWAIVSAPDGSGAGFDNPASAAPVFTPDLAGSYSLSVVATDQNGLASTPAFASVTVSACSSLGPTVGSITVNNAPLGSPIGLTPSGVADRHCPAQSSFSYAWRLATRPAGSSALMSSPLTTGPTSFVADVAGTYEIGLIATDAAGLSSPEIFQVVNVAPCGSSTFNWGPSSAPITASFFEPGTSLPTAAGTPLNVGATAVLQANFTEANSQCIDAPLAPYTYGWSLISRPYGSKAQLNSTTDAMPGFVADVYGTYQATVRVTDALGNSSAPSAPISITTSPCGTAVPVVAITNTDATLSTHSIAGLHLATGSPTDADDDTSKCTARFGITGYTYLWRIVGSSIGGAAVIQNATQPDAAFVPSAPGTYAVRLEATASSGVTGVSAPVTFTATTCGTNPPVVYGVGVSPGSSPKAGDTLTLSATADSPDATCGGVTVPAYTWSLVSAPAGSGVAAPGMQTGTAANTFSFRADLAGTYRFAVTATDSNGLTSAPFPVTVSTAACKPTFTASAPATAPVGTAVTASTGTPADTCIAGAAFSYAWTLLSRPAGSHAVLGNATSANASLTPDLTGSYELQALVTDSAGNASDPQLLRIDAGSCGSLPPVVNSASALPAVPNAGDAVAFSVDATNQNSSCATPQATSFTYVWTVLSAPAGSTAALASRTTAQPTFVPDVPGTYQVTVVVTDGFGNHSNPYPVTLTTSDCGRHVPTVAIAASGSTTSLDATVPLTLTATATDLDNSVCPSRFAATFRYAWSITATPAGGQASLSSGSGASTVFQADAAGNYTVTVVATASSGVSSAPVSQAITVSACGATPPTVLAVRQTVGGVAVSQPKVNDSIQLAASAFDSGCGLAPLTYSWSTVSTPAGGAFSQSASANSLTFQPGVPGGYAFRVKATDAAGVSSAPFDVTVAVAGSCSLAISASASPTSVQVGSSVSLAAGAVTDSCVPAGSTASALSYHWAVAARPAGSSAVVVTPASAANSFVPDVAGDYTLQLVVTDGGGYSGVATASVHAGACSQSPSVTSIAAAMTEPDGSAPSPALATNAAYPGDTVSLSATIGPSGCGVAPSGVSYRWTLLSQPAASSALLLDATSATPSFIADLAGASWQVMLIATDSLGASSAPAFITITTSTCGQTPPVVTFQPFTNPLRFNPVTLTAAATDSDSTSCPTRLQPSGAFTWRWSIAGKPAGASPALSAGTGNTATFTGDVAGAYQVQAVAVASNGAASNSAPATVTVGNCSAGPVASGFGATQTAPAGTNLSTLHTNLPTQLSISVADAGGCGVSAGPMSLQWTLSSVPAGSHASLSGATSATPTLTPDVAGTYTFLLAASDSLGSTSSSFSITTDACGTAAPISQSFLATQTLPVGGPILSAASSGAPAFVGGSRLDVAFPIAVSTVTQDADVAGCNLSTTPAYSWTLTPPAGSHAALSGSAGTTAAFVPDVVGNYVLLLTLTDPLGPTSTQTFTLPVTCAPTGSAAVDGTAPAFTAKQVMPLINVSGAGQVANFTIQHSTFPDTDLVANQHLNVPFYLGAGVQLFANVHDAGAENVAACPGGYPETVAYKWELARTPAGSIAQLNDPTLQSPSFDPDVAGEYDVRLTLTDSLGNVGTQLFALGPTGSATRPLIGAGFCGTQAPAPNIGLLQPVAVASIGSSVSAAPTTTFIQLDSSQSRLPDNDPLVLATGAGCGLQEAASYSWSFTAVPPGASTALSSTTTTNPTFATPLAGDYGIRLVVTTDAGKSSSADATIHLTTPGSVSVAASNPTPTVGDSPFGTDVIATVLDSSARPLVSQLVSFAVTTTTDPLNDVLSPTTAVTNGFGQATVHFTAHKAEPKQVTATAGTKTGVSPAITFQPGAVYQLKFTTQPSVTAKNVPIPAVVVEGADQFDNTEPAGSYTGGVNMSLLENTATLSGTLSHPAGTPFDDLTINNTGTYHLVATDATGLLTVATRTSAAFDVQTSQPNPPTNLTGSSTGTTSTSLTWNQSTAGSGKQTIIDPNITGYDVYRDGVKIVTTVGQPTLLIASPPPGSSCQAGSTPPKTCTFADTGLSEGTTYSYTVKAVEPGAPDSAAAGPLSLQTDPKAAINVSVTPTPGLEQTSLRIRWNDPTNPGVPSTYRLFRRNSPAGTPTQVGTDIAAGAGSYSVDNGGRTAGTQYFYFVRSVLNGQTTDSAQVSLYTAPAQVTNFRSTAQTTSSITLAWSAVTISPAQAGQPTYVISRGTSTTFTDFFNGITGTSFTDNNLVPGITYNYAIHAVNPDNVPGPDVTLSQATVAAKWTSFSSGLSGGWIGDLLFDPSNPATVYAATGKRSATSTAGGIFRSGNIDNATPANVTWTAVSGGLPNGSVVTALAGDPASGALLAGTNGQGVFRSWDGGVTWESLGGGAAIADVSSLTVDALSAYYVGGFTGGISRFDTLAASPTWVAATGTPATTVQAILQDSSSGAFYAQASGGTATGGFFTSPDGLTWTRQATAFTTASTAAGSDCAATDANAQRALAVATSAPPTIFFGSQLCGVLKASPPSGAGTWTFTAIDPSSPVDVVSLAAVFRTNKMYLWAASAAATSFLAPGATTFTALSGGPSSVSVLSLKPGGTSVLAVADSGGTGMYRSVNADATPAAGTIQSATGGLSNVRVDGLAFDSAVSKTWAWGPQIGLMLGTFTTSWASGGLTCTNNLISNVIVNAGASTSTAYALCNATDATRGFYTSSSAGAWTKKAASGLANLPFQGPLTIATGTTNVVYVALDNSPNGTAIYQTSDDGATFTATSLTGLPSNAVVTALGANASGSVFAGLSGGQVQKLTAGAPPWATVASAPSNAIAFFLDTRPNPDDIYAASSTAGVFVSAATGTPSWSSLNTGLGSTAVNVFGGLVTTGSPVLLAGNASTPGAAFSSLYTSTNGTSWSAANVGIFGGDVGSTALLTTSNMLAGTTGGGVYKTISGGQ